VKEGTIGTIRITIPWNNLSQKPIVLELDKVLILATSKMVPTVDKAAELAQQLAEKRSFLAKFDFHALTENSDSEQRGFDSQFLNRLFDNVKLHVTNVHIRFENDLDDRRINKNAPQLFAFGFYIILFI
jgi:vacuolar protein sorting-associated protein 13A/C